METTMQTTMQTIMQTTMLTIMQTIMQTTMATITDTIKMRLDPLPHHHHPELVELHPQHPLPRFLQITTMARSANWSERVHQRVLFASTSLSARTNVSRFPNSNVHPSKKESATPGRLRAAT